MSPSLPSPGRLLLSQLTPVSKSSPVDNDRVYKNPFYSPTFLPFLARQVPLPSPPATSSSRFSTSTDSRVERFSFLKKILRANPEKRFERLEDSFWICERRERKCFKRNACTSVLQGETTGRVDTETEKVSVGQTAASPFLLSPSSSSSSPPLLRRTFAILN